MPRLKVLQRDKEGASVRRDVTKSQVGRERVCAHHHLLVARAHRDAAWYPCQRAASCACGQTHLYHGEEGAVHCRRELRAADVCCQREQLELQCPCRPRQQPIGHPPPRRLERFTDCQLSLCDSRRGRGEVGPDGAELLGPRATESIQLGVATLRVHLGKAHAVRCDETRFVRQVRGFEASLGVIARLSLAHATALELRRRVPENALCLRAHAVKRVEAEHGVLHRPQR
mmetsp:Transcript_69913/g.123565  ORF Transcript_69913/g.123565 Transcript_69913/m.123565 type:complete len:229 (-) Transcript_69913:5-691(-)